jgi:hypothetical protein
MTVLTFPQTRSLAQVLAELMLAEGELKRLRLIPADQMTVPEEYRWSHLEDVTWLRRDEARAMIEAATGCKWADIQEALA